MVRTLLIDKSDHLVISTDRPTVKLYLDKPGPPSHTLQNTLDYSKPDDELVGYAFGYGQKHTNADVYILTHDTGPMATAQAVGLSYSDIPDKWLIGSQQDSADPEKARLLARVAELERREPRITLQFVDGEYIADGQINVEYLVYKPLSTDKIEPYIEEIRRLCPEQTEFGLSEDVGSVTSPFGRAAGMGGTYKPATEEEIRRYHETDYPRWLSSCESFLFDLHSTLQTQQPRPLFELMASKCRYQTSSRCVDYVYRAGRRSNLCGANVGHRHIRGTCRRAHRPSRSTAGSDWSMDRTIRRSRCNVDHRGAIFIAGS